ncbi:DUF5689 domain-containing protein [Flavobacterium sp. NRK F10]|uniref:DUF5689 domain-containing protein n=1 Tax=Flavobacterium sp. NRK F10 TaxID=2954931 RepID=UPI0020909ABB|nr:DUF5689 domain-containing protein [Flavobacterium sp. NRK F10]MCO6174692.1 DUF5689 domain-containing protein [Flavobacterium sp. NRK F10]
MKNIKLLLTLTTFAALTSCVNGDDYGTPDLSSECVSETPTKQVSDITSIAATDNPTQYMADDVIEAYVTSSDEGGNFYKTISLVSTDAVNNPNSSIGFTIPINAYNLYTKFEPGRKVYVHLKDLYYSYTGLTDSYEIGELYVDPTYGNEIGRISAVKYENVILRGCDKVDEDELVNHITIDQVDDSYMHKLIEFENVQFADGSLGTTYFDPTNTAGTGTNHSITDMNGNTIDLRASEYASFASDPIPSGSGKIRGVLTKYNGSYQFMIRTLHDVQLNDDRFDVDFYPPIVGSSLAFNGSLFENFESYATYENEFPPYINDAAVGSRYWQVRLFSGNRYIQATSFGGNEDNRTLFIVPVDMTSASTFSFRTNDGYDNGSVLKVYYSLDYIAGGLITDATLVDITSNFTISSGHSSGYGTFIDSGVYNIPSGITGNGYFIFEYVGNGASGPTTTMQIDNITIN